MINNIKLFLYGREGADRIEERWSFGVQRYQ
jgi:hypothetical protein